jgi:DNA-binding NarL/FixJ family response regulator
MNSAPPVTHHMRAMPRRCEVLTDQQRLVLKLLAGGMSNKQIAAHMGRSPETVKSHVQGIFAVLKVRCRVQAAVVAAKAGLA